MHSALPHFIKKNGGFKGGTAFRRAYYAKRGGGKSFRKWVIKSVNWDASVYYASKTVRKARYVTGKRVLATKTFNKWIITFLGISFFGFDILYKTNWVYVSLHRLQHPLGKRSINKSHGTPAFVARIGKRTKQWYATPVLSLDETHLVVVRDLFTEKSHPSASTMRAQLSVAATTAKSTDLLNCDVKT